MATPRIRSDLQATPAEEGGIKYFDVSDPKSGARMRMYDFEWLIAERMDGRRPFDEVASWARERLGIGPSASDIEEYARRLRELGFFELEADEPHRAPPTAPTMMGAAPTLPSTNNGAGRAAESDSDKIQMPPLVAEGPLMGGSAPATEAVEPPPRPAPPPAATAPTMAMPAPERPVMPAERPAPPRSPVPATRPAAEPRGPVATAEAQPPARSSAASIVGIIVVLLLVAGIIAYVKLMGGAAAKVSTVVATPREVVRLYDGAAAVKKSEGQTLAFGEAGKVSDVVAVGTEAKAGMPLASLDSYAKVEKELADVKDREVFYTKQLESAKAKNDEAAIKAADAKVAEKKKLVAELEARVAKVRLVAPGAGTVAAVLVQAGGDAQPGQPVIKLTDKRMMADFKLPAADAARMKAGQTVSVQPASGGAPFDAHVAAVNGDTVTVEVPEGAAKPGDALRLVKARVANVVPLPPSAVVHKDGGDVVYVLADGAVHERKVNVVDKSGNQTLVGGGLQPGDQVVASGGENLHDGQKAAQ